MKNTKESKLLTFLPSIICGIIILAFLFFWSSIKPVVDDNANGISAVTGIISVILSGFAVYYGRKAYLVAQDIFEKGISINKEKVINQLGLEFVVDMFIPLSKLKKSLYEYYEDDIQNVLVQELFSVLKNNKLTDRFVYYESHKSEIWDSLTICANQEIAFSEIRSFVNNVERFQNKLDGIITVLDDKDNLKGEKRLKDIFGEDDKLTKKFSDLMSGLNEVLAFEKKLPDELGILDKKNRMYRDLI